MSIRSNLAIDTNDSANRFLVAETLNKVEHRDSRAVAHAKRQMLPLVRLVPQLHDINIKMGQILERLASLEAEVDKKTCDEEQGENVNPWIPFKNNARINNFFKVDDKLREKRIRGLNRWADMATKVTGHWPADITRKIFKRSYVIKHFWDNHRK